MKFKKLAYIDCHKIHDEHKATLNSLSIESPVNYEGIPETTQDLAQAIKGCDGVLVSLKVDLNSEVIAAAPELKYIGVCGSSLKRIDLEAAKNQNIEVRNVLEYCDTDTAHFPVLEIANLVRGLGRSIWRERPQSLEGKTLGIIGLGAVGVEVAKLANAFGMRVNYTSRNRKSDIEHDKLSYKKLDNLLAESDFVSLHTPPHQKILYSKHFQSLGQGKILVNTCLGRVFEAEPLQEWLASPSNFAIFDTVALDSFGPLGLKTPNLIASKRAAYKTLESSQRLSAKILENAKSYLKK